MALHVNTRTRWIRAREWPQSSHPTWRLFLAIAVAGLWLALPPQASATGGIYQVTACNQAGNVNYAWTAWNGDASRHSVNGGCTMQAYVLNIYQNVNVSSPFWYSGSGFRFTAPAGTTIYNAYCDCYLNRYASSDVWRVSFRFGDGLLGWSDKLGGYGTSAYAWNSSSWFRSCPIQQDN